MVMSKVFGVLFFLTFAIGIHASESPNFSFTSAELNKELSQKTVRQIYQDSTGYLWIVTQEGLSRYDGYQLLSFMHDPRQPNSLGSDNVRAVLEDEQQRLWIATDGGGLKPFQFWEASFFSVTVKMVTASTSPSSNAASEA